MKKKSLVFATSHLIPWFWRRELSTASRTLLYFLHEFTGPKHRAPDEKSRWSIMNIAIILFGTSRKHRVLSFPPISLFVGSILHMFGSHKFCLTESYHPILWRNEHGYGHIWYWTTHCRYSRSSGYFNCFETIINSSTVQLRVSGGPDYMTEIVYREITQALPRTQVARHLSELTNI